MSKIIHKQGKTISYWHSEGANHLYMDDEGHVYSVVPKEYNNKPSKPKKWNNMKYFKTKIMIMSTIIFCLWVGILKANEPTKYYTASIADNRFTPTMVTALDLNVKWVNLKSLQNIIITSSTVSMSKAQLDFEYYKSIGDVLEIKSGIYNVKFIKEFRGFWIYEVLEIYDTNNQQDML